MALKPFVINLNDLAFLLKQVNFVPLFDAATNGNGLVAFDGTVDAYSSKGVLLWDTTLNGGAGGLTAEALALQFTDLASLGTGFPHASAAIGVRDPSGQHNNLFGSQADWGAVDVPFVRLMGASYDNYATDGSFTGDYGVIGSDVTDAMPRIISRTITTAGVNLLTDANGNFVEWDPGKYGLVTGITADPSYVALLNERFNGNALTALTATQISHMVDGAKIVVPGASTLAWDPIVYVTSHFYNQALQAQASGLAFDGHLYGSATGGALVDGGPVYVYLPTVGTGGTYVALSLNGVPVTFNAVLYSYEGLANQAAAQSGLTLSLLTTGHPIPVDPALLADVGDMPAADLAAFLTSDSGYGLLEALGHIDFQNPNSGEFFIGSENPGVAPVNSWFGIFGQFFDHGLDFIGKGGAGKITIALDPSDPLYNETPNHAITISRASPSGVDANDDAAYVNHTSPFIDQSQTYGSVDQITNILRKWVSTDGGLTYHAGIELFDGTTLVDAWERKWPDGTTQMVHDTLPTLNELRQHVIDTGRAPITWEDVLDLRLRDSNGQLLDTDGNNTNGVQTSGSGHALLLDMNPHFDGVVAGTGHISDAAIAEFNAQFGTNYTAADFSVMAVLPHVNADFSIKGTLTQAQHDAVSEILMQSVGDHYVAGDGRVNENFGLTSIHHVFHEEHNFQVENLKTWIYAHDLNNPGATDPHEQLHNWQNNTGVMDASGVNYLNSDGSIAWDLDKMFEATKLIVEMEYQHAAVDQYARTITPRIQEFVGYSTGVDSTISLEYAQVAFRFGHSTIRETIDAIDPDGWMFGHVTRYALEKAFLAPQTFAEEGVAAITLGLSRQQMNEVDEFLTPALNQGLLGQPLDLAAINIARGRDLGIPTLNEFRAAISLAQYTSWADFGAGMQHPESLVNFIAAYAFGGNVALAEAAMLDNNFMNNTPDAGGAIPVGADAFNKIDSWIGGLAEVHVPGGLLGETFDAVFVAQIQSLMDGDRFYYLYRLFGTQIHEEVNNGQFKDIVERNTGLEHLNGSIFAYADKYYDFNRGADGTLTDTTGDYANHLYADLVATGRGVYSDGGDITQLNQNGSSISVVASDGIRANVNLTNLIRDVRAELDPTQVHTVEGTPTSGADSHEVIVATANADFIHGRAGDDTIYGEEGDDYIYADGGVDRSYGGDGDDMIDTGEGPDLADGGAGKDIIYGRGSGAEVGGFDQLVGGSGNDLVIGGEGIDKLSGGSGDDIIYGDGITNPEMGNTDPFTHAGDGNDYVDGGASGDLLFGEEGDDYIVGGADQDLMQGGQGDDIIRPGGPSQATGTTGGPDEVVGDDAQANVGFDLIDLSDHPVGGPGVLIDFATQNNPLVAIDQMTPFPAWFQIEGAIGTSSGDTFIGDSLGDATAANSLGNNWLIGGSGNDTFTGAGGNDLVIGGSIRLDSLIGSYEDAANASGDRNLQLGSMPWIQDAMRTGSEGLGFEADGVTATTGPDGYDNDTENTYTGSSNQAVGALQSNGLIDAANAVGGAQFDKHFTDMLRSRMFKDTVLGDNGTDGTADTVVLSGNRADYSIVEINFAAPDGTAITAYKITDNRPVDPVTGLLLADGVTPGDGTDLIVGIDAIQFADIRLTSDQFGNAPATGAVIVSGFATANTAGVAAPQAPFGPLHADVTTIADTDGLGAFTYQWQSSVDGGVTWTNIPGASSQDYQAQPADVGSQLRVVVSYTDGAGVPERLVSAATEIVGEYLQDLPGNNVGELQGAAGQDILIGLGGADQLQGGDGSDWLNGGGGADQMQGGIGNDTYVVDNTGDTVNEAANGGIDTVLSSVSVSLAANVENLTLTGGSNSNGTGNALDNLITGNSGNNRLEGGAGNDTLDGGSAGLDTARFSGPASNYVFSVNAANNVVVTDTVGTDGTDTLINIDQVQFNGGNPNYTLRSLLNGAGGTDTGTGGLDVIVGGDGADTLSGGNQNDIIFGGAGDDSITWNAGNGRDVVDGGSSSSTLDGGAATTAGDTFVINGNAQTEIFNIYAADQLTNLATTLNTTFNAGTQIVVTRTAGGNTAVIAELKSIEELVVNTTAIPGGVGGPFTAGSDTVNVIGNFSGILNPNTITINGGEGHIVVDVSQMTSSEHVVLNTNGTYEIVDGGTGTGQVTVNGSTDASSGGSTDPGASDNDSTGTNSGPDSGPGSSSNNGEHEDDDNDTHHAGPGSGPGSSSNDDEHDSNDDNAHESHHARPGSGPDSCSDDGAHDSVGGVAQLAAAANGGTSAGAITGSEASLLGTAGADVIFGTDANKVIYADAGADVISTGDTKTVVMAGSGADVVDGGAAGDVIFGGADSDIIDAGGGSDKVFGEDGDDLVYGRDGDDLLFGDGGQDEIHAGAGSDRIEGGEGADLLFGDAGDDLFVFRTAGEADGDTIGDLQSGDVVDLSFIDANGDGAGNGSFSILQANAFTTTGQLIVHFDAGKNATIVEGNTDANTATAEFQLTIDGDHVNALVHNNGNVIV